MLTELVSRPSTENAMIKSPRALCRQIHAISPLEFHWYFQKLSVVTSTPRRLAKSGAAVVLTAAPLRQTDGGLKDWTDRIEDATRTLWLS
jgi:hypothetical protein